MSFKSINPATGQLMLEIPVWDTTQIEATLTQVAAATPDWAATPILQRAEGMQRAAAILRARRDVYARLITEEMGKLLKEARAEVDKCALACDYYAAHAPYFLADEYIASDAAQSFVNYQPLGTVLAVMPWNFPLWQVFRFAVPALMAGNTGVLKHASNVPQCAQLIEQVFHEAGFPAGVFRSLMISAAQTSAVIADRRIHAVTLTGSEAAGRQVAATAAQHLKKSVLELGGSDAFIVLEDADLEMAVAQAVASRFLNCGQSCIAAKRFIVVDAIAEEFLARFKAAAEKLQPGDPLSATTTLAPLARVDLRDAIHQQVLDSVAQGAVVVTGGNPLPGPGAFYAPTILDQVLPGTRAYGEEFFGPVALLLRARDAEHAIALANDSCFGLGGSVWTRDTTRGIALARRVQAGCCFVNGMVKSDARLPFGGIKASGYGRELSYHGLREFVNAKTIWVR